MSTRWKPTARQLDGVPVYIPTGVSDDFWRFTGMLCFQSEPTPPPPDTDAISLSPKVTE